VTTPITTGDPGEVFEIPETVATFPATIEGEENTVTLKVQSGDLTVEALREVIDALTYSTVPITIQLLMDRAPLLLSVERAAEVLAITPAEVLAKIRLGDLVAVTEEGMLNKRLAHARVTYASIVEEYHHRVNNHRHAAVRLAHDIGMPALVHSVLRDNDDVWLTTSEVMRLTQPRLNDETDTRGLPRFEAKYKTVQNALLRAHKLGWAERRDLPWTPYQVGAPMEYHWIGPKETAE
jgi:hypothetical protein